MGTRASVYALANNLFTIQQEAEERAMQLAAEEDAQPNGRYLQRTAYPDTVAAPRNWRPTKLRKLSGGTAAK